MGVKKGIKMRMGEEIEIFKLFCTMGEYGKTKR